MHLLSSALLCNGKCNLAHGDQAAARRHLEKWATSMQRHTFVFAPPGTLVGLHINTSA